MLKMPLENVKEHNNTDLSQTSDKFRLQRVDTTDSRKREIIVEKDENLLDPCVTSDHQLEDMLKNFPEVSKKYNEKNGWHDMYKLIMDLTVDQFYDEFIAT